MKTSELVGDDLDFAVAKCTGYDHLDSPADLCDHQAFSTDNALGGPLIDEYGISTVRQYNGEWWAFNDCDAPLAKDGIGPTRLIAAMRCIVAIKFGDEVNF